MLPSVHEISMSLYGAWRLAHLDADGLDRFGTTIDAFWRSFFAAVIVAPFFIVLMAMIFELGLVETSAARFIAIQAIAYVVAWLAFPYVMLAIARLLDRDARYVRYIIAYNWAAVLQNALYMPIVALIVAGAIPDALALVAHAVIMFYTWFITRTALDISGRAAVAIVLLDLILSIFIKAYADSMM